MNRAKMNRWALLAMLPLCAAASFATAANPPMEHEETRADSNQPGSDTWITTKVKADLLATDKVPGLEIKVETVNGAVTLSGTVDTQAEKDRAIGVARGIDGVKNVDASNLRVAGNPTR